MTKTRYFALVLNDRPPTNPHSVFREVHDGHGGGWRFEIWDRSLRAWREEMGLGVYTMCGEIGDHPITRAEARKVIKAQANIPWPAPAQASPDISFRPLRWRRRRRSNPEEWGGPTQPA